MKKSLKDNFKKTSMAEALKEHKPLTKKESERITKRMNTFYAKLRKDFGGERFDLFTATIISVATPDGLLTNLRGNMHTAQFAMANAINVLVENVADTLKLTRESILLYCITDLADEVRGIWKEKQSSQSKDVPIKVPIKSVE